MAKRKRTGKAMAKRKRENDKQRSTQQYKKPIDQATRTPLHTAMDSGAPEG
jgi:hypothetical protein